MEGAIRGGGRRSEVDEVEESHQRWKGAIRGGREKSDERRRGAIRGEGKPSET